MKIINTAYHILSDPERRKEHDQWIAMMEEKETGQAVSGRANQHAQPDVKVHQRVYRFGIDALLYGLVKKKLEVDSGGIRLDNTFIATQDVSYIIVSILQQTANGIRTGTFHTLVVGSNENKISIHVNDTFYGSSKRKLFAEVHDAVMEFIGASLLRRMVETIAKNGDISIGDAVFTTKGAWLVDRTLLIFRSGPAFVPYERLNFSLVGGKICLSDRQNRKSSAVFSLLSTKNAYMVGPLYNALVTHGKWRH